MAGIATHESDTDVQNAVINSAAGGDITVVAAASGQRINVVKIVLVVGAATNITLKDGSSPGAISGPMPFAANMGWAQDFDKACMVLTKGNAFIINSSNAVQVSGFVYYTQRAVSQG